MHNKIVKASSGSIIPTGFNPFGTSKSPLDDMNKMKLGAPGPSKEFTKAAQKMPRVQLMLHLLVIKWECLEDYRQV